MRHKAFVTYTSIKYFARKIISKTNFIFAFREGVATNTH